MEKRTVSLRLPIGMAEDFSRIGEGSINQGVVEAYYTLKRHEKLADTEIKGLLTDKEWLFLADTLNGTKVEGDFRFSKNFLATHCLDAQVYDRAGDKWGIDVDNFVERIGSLPSAYIDAIYRRVERFWELQPDINEWARY